MNYAHIIGGRKESNVDLRDGFTLLELLVVIGVIAVLASLLLPALSKAKQSAHSVTCKNNLRQWAVSFQLHTDDFQFYPPYGLSESGKNEDYKTWKQRLAIYMQNKFYTYADAVNSGGTRLKGIDICPGYDRLRGMHGSYGHIGSYAYNKAGLMKNITPEGNFGLGGNIVMTRLGPEDIRCIRESEISNPSDMIAMSDSMLYWIPNDTPIYSFLGYDELGFGSPGREPIYAALKLGNMFTPDKNIIDNSLRGIQNRHGGRWNTLFCDGHVESLKTAELFDPRKDEILRRWNKDNLPHRESIIIR